MARVVILGGGFGGLAAATELRERLDDDDEIVLVARDDRFAMGWTKLWDLTGVRPLAEGTRELRALAERGIRYLQADVTAIEPDQPAATTTSGDLEGDALVVALGAADHPDHVARFDGTFAHNLYSFEGLPAAKSALAGLTGGRLLVTVLGQPFKCPPAPFEAILAIDAYLRVRGDRAQVDLAVATPAPGALPVAGPEASRAVADALSARDITLDLKRRATRIDAVARSVTFDTGDDVAADLVFGVPANVAPAVVAASPLAGDGGFIHPDRHTLRTAFDRVYAVGDCTTVPTATAALPKAGVFAAAEGRVAARNVAADLGHGAPASFDGHGFCYLEFPDREVAVVEGDFFAEPEPDVTMVPPTRAAFEAKLAFETERLGAWFGD